MYLHGQLLIPFRSLLILVLELSSIITVSLQTGTSRCNCYETDVVLRLQIQKNHMEIAEDLIRSVDPDLHAEIEETIQNELSLVRSFCDGLVIIKEMTHRRFGVTRAYTHTRAKGALHLHRDLPP